MNATCKTSRRPSRPLVEAWRRWSQTQQRWNWSKASADHSNATRNVAGVIVEATFPPQTEPVAVDY